MTTAAEPDHPDWRAREEEATSPLGAFFRSISLGFGALNLFGEETPVVEVDKPARGLAAVGLIGYRPESPEDDLERYQMSEYIAPAPSTTGVLASSRPWEQLTVTDMASPAEARAILTTLLSSIAAADQEPGRLRQYMEQGLGRHKQNLRDLELKNLQLQASIDKCVLASPGAAHELHAWLTTAPNHRLVLLTSCARPVPTRPCVRCPHTSAAPMPSLCPRLLCAHPVYPSPPYPSPPYPSPPCHGRARSRGLAAAEALEEQLRHIHMMESQLRIVNHWVEDWVTDCSSRSRRSMHALVTAPIPLPHRSFRSSHSRHSMHGCIKWSR